MRDYDESSAQYEMDEAYAACAAKAFRDPVYAVYNGLPSYAVKRIEPAINGKFVMHRYGSVVRYGNENKYMYNSCDVNGKVFPEIKLDIYMFKIIPTKKNVGHDCYCSKEVYVPAESKIAARQYLEEYLAQRYREKGIDDSWFEIKE